MKNDNEKKDLMEGDKERKYVKIDNFWYDITHFIKKHPGGPIIKEFAFQDASNVFHSMHEKNVLEHWKPIENPSTVLFLNENFSTNLKESKNERITQTFRALHQQLIAQGYFETDYRWYMTKFILTGGFLLLAVLLACETDSLLRVTLGSFFFFFFWQQCGFLMHDLMHSQFTHDMLMDRMLSLFFSTVCFGVSGHWWKDEHIYHHALTCVVDKQTRFADPQMVEPIWAQNKKLFFLYEGFLSALCIKVQHYTFLPACIFFGRLGIVIDSHVQEKRWYEWVAFGLHCLLFLCIFSKIKSWSLVLWFYSLASILEGVLHIQLLISHYSKPFHDKQEFLEEQTWYQSQVETNINIVTPKWIDWFHGGLNFHIEHHLFPRMPRHNFRAASKKVKEVCKGLDIVYDECHFFEAITRTIKGLKEASQHYSLDPR